MGNSKNAHSILLNWQKNCQVSTAWQLEIAKNFREHLTYKGSFQTVQTILQALNDVIVVGELSKPQMLTELGDDSCRFKFIFLQKSDC